MQPREQIAQICRQIYRAGLTTTSGGNLSVRDDDGTIWISPAAVDKGGLRAKDVVGLHADGTQSGRQDPSSEYPFHRAIYDARPDLKAIVHAHPPALVAFSIARRRPNTGILPGMLHACGTVGYAPYALPGSEELGKGIAAEFALGCQGVIMENHGAVVGGHDLPDAFVRFEALEFTARIELNARLLGADATLDGPSENRAAQPAGCGGMGQGRQDGAGPSKTDRETLARLARRLYRQGLAPSLAGSLSVRGRDGMITLQGVPCWEASPSDTVRVRDGEPRDQRLAIHQAIYRHNPAVHSIIVAPPPHVMAFGVAHTALDVRTIPESWILLQDIGSVAYGRPGQDPQAFARLFGPERPAALVRHDALYVTGATALQAFDRLEVAELSARALILGRQLGGVSPMDERQVEALRQRFLAPGSQGLAVSEA